MPKELSEMFPYGLSNLPMEPPEDPRALGAPAGAALFGSQSGTGAQMVPVQFRYPRPRQNPAGAYPAPEWAPPWPAPQIPEPRIPDWLKTFGAALQLYPKIIAGSGGGGGGGDDEDCYQRWETENRNCNSRRARYRPGCRERATERMRMCVQNRGKPSPNEPPEWGIADEW